MQQRNWENLRLQSGGKVPRVSLVWELSDCVTLLFISTCMYIHLLRFELQLRYHLWSLYLNARPAATYRGECLSKHARSCCQRRDRVSPAAGCARPEDGTAARDAERQGLAHHLREAQLQRQHQRRQVWAQCWYHSAMLLLQARFVIACIYMISFGHVSATSKIMYVIVEYMYM